MYNKIDKKALRKALLDYAIVQRKHLIDLRYVRMKLLLGFGAKQ